MVCLGSVLGPQLFTIYINDLEEGTKRTVAMFADGAKICTGTGSFEEAWGLQKDLDKLGEWAKKWQMEYNVEKCEIMHFGRRNGDIDYFLYGKMLRKSETQRDLAVLVQDSLKVNVQVQSAHAMPAFMSRWLEYKHRDVLLRLHKALVRAIWSIVSSFGPCI